MEAAATSAGHPVPWLRIPNLGGSDRYRRAYVRSVPGAGGGPARAEEPGGRERSGPGSDEPNHELNRRQKNAWADLQTCGQPEYGPPLLTACWQEPDTLLTAWWQEDRFILSPAIVSTG